MDDITKALAYEIKQDIANRYFGFRKRIETESSQYLDSLQSAGQEYSIGITTEMQRMHCLLGNDQLFSAFINFTKLPENSGWFAADPQSPAQWRLLFADLKGEGFTRKRRYRNLVYKVYRLLVGSISLYQDMFIRLEEEHEDICGQIDRFSRKNDLSGILGFLRQIDNPDAQHSELLHSEGPLPAGRSMEQQLRILPPPPVTSHMPSLNQVPCLDIAKPTLDALIKQAFPLVSQSSTIKLPF